MPQHLVHSTTALLHHLPCTASGHLLQVPAPEHCPSPFRHRAVLQLAVPSHLTSSCSPTHALRSPLPDHTHPADPKACSWQPGVTADTFSKPEVPLHCLRVGISFPLFHRPFHFSISDGFLKEKHTNHKNTHFRCILNFFLNELAEADLHYLCTS